MDGRAASRAIGRLTGRPVWLAAVGVTAGALALFALIVLAAGFDPVQAVAGLLGHALGTSSGLTEVAVRMVPLTLTGLGIVVAFRARMFNVGGDGQIILGAMAFTGFAVAFPGLSGWILLPVALAAGFIGGAAWGGIAGYLRARYSVNGIIVTIMLNYIAVQVLGWAIRGPMQESAKVFPRSDAVPDSVVLGVLIDGSRLHWGLTIALAATLIVFVLFRFTSFGYRLDAVRESPAAARQGGIDDRRVIFLSLAVSGGLAGLAGAVEISAIHQRLQDSFAEGLGITAIAVALLARLNPLFVPLAALIFGVLSVGASALQRQMAIPFPLVHIIEAIVIMSFLVLSYAHARQARGA